MSSLHARRFAALFVLSSIGITAARSAPEDFAEIRAAYTNRCTMLMTAYEEARERSLVKFEEDIRAIEAGYRKTGDPQGALRARGELERLENDRRVPKADDENLSPLVRNARMRQRNALAEARRTMDTQVRQLARAYAHKLEPLKNRLVIEGRIEEAKEVDVEINLARSVASNLGSPAPPVDAGQPDAAPVSPPPSVGLLEEESVGALDGDGDPASGAVTGPW